MRKIPLKTTLLFLIVLAALNLAYYHHTKDLILDSQKEKIQLLYSSLLANIEQTSAGELFVEEQIGKNLRTAAVAAKFKLNPDIGKVSNEELVELSEQLGVDHITLFEKQQDDIIGVRSSDPKDVGVNARGWDVTYDAFKQLFNGENVHVGIGQALPHYWSEPFNTSSSNPASIDKWGYYYDGTTGYLINPFVHDTSLRQYQKMAGIDATIQRLKKDNESMGLEISVLNANTLLEKKIPSVNPTPDSFFSERLVLFGDYKYRDAEEKKYAQLAIDSDTSVYYVATSDGKEILKSFTPIRADYLKYNPAGAPPLIEISIHADPIQEKLSEQLNQTLFFMFVCTCLSLALMGVMFMLTQRKKEEAVQEVQETYAGNIETLFQSIREQRHDFINHLQTIHGFLTMKHYDELQAYTEALVGEIRVVNDLVNINNPPLIALLQAKIAQAERLQISFEHVFGQMDKLKLSAVKATDIVKMLSNLIDNAFDASMELDPDHRFVTVEGDIVGNQLQLKVANDGNPIPEDVRQKLFQRGFTSKHNGKNSGLGLHIVHELVKKYKGTIQVKSEDGTTEFSISIPMTKW
ncbi:sensor histidine kinase [Paenibacillus hamazuiensis]|uniref:sensor histidine kinase n=1 Tax=Paenibacillus hamazuiensis TaxID=2936508 RepID=UPI00200F55C1|nr:ATP-binding protein [Paenibacillus hamazuiensis]